MFIWKHECQATTLTRTKERENAQKCDDPASLEKEKKKTTKKRLNLKTSSSNCS